MVTSSATPATVIQKLFVLCAGIPADTILAPQLAQQVVHDGNWGAVAVTVNGYLAHEAELNGGAALVIRMAHQGLGLELDSAQAAAIAAIVSSGQSTWADLALSVVNNAEASFSTTLDNRAAAAQAFTDALVAQGKGSLYSGSNLFGAAQSLLEGITANAATLQEATSSLVELVHVLGAQGVGHSATDGYLSSATVFVDGNHNGVLDEGEFTTTTDVGGQLHLPANAPAGDLVAINGTDLMTGEHFMGYMTAPAGATVITPLTTLMQELVSSGAAKDVLEAMAMVKLALGLPDINLLNYDPLDVLADPLASAADKAQALAVEGTSVEVMNLITLTSVSLAGVTGVDIPHAAVIVLDAIGAAIASGAPLDLTDADRIDDIVTASVTGYFGVPPADTWTSGIEQLAEVIAASNTEADEAGSLVRLAKVVHVAQGDVAQALEGVFHGDGSLGDVLGDFTGTNLEAAIAAASTGFLKPGMPIAGQGGGLPQIPPTLTVVDTLLGGREDAYLRISYDTLAAAADENDLNGDPLSFRIESITTGMLQEWTGSAWVDAVAGATLLSAGEEVRWKPAHNANGAALDAFTVTAWDGTEASETAVQVTVKVASVSDNQAPTGVALDPSSIDENNAPGATVGTLFGIDPNKGDTFTFGLVAGVGSTDNANFSIVGNTLVLNSQADHETQQSYSIRLSVTDDSGATVQAVQVINVNDVDESAPTITSPGTVAAVDENVSAGVIVYTAIATDSGDISSGITFSLGGADAGYFDIDASAGTVTLKDSPDHETKSGYSFTVVATDGGGNDDSIDLTLAINDLDDSAPSITSSASAGVDENVSAGWTVYTVTSDDTGDISSGVTYSFGASGIDNDAFGIDASTGDVTIKLSPDAEAQASYTFDVVATDAAGNHTEQTVTLTVNDLDEADPVLTSPASAGAIDENVNAGTLVYTAAATDSGDISSGITFSLAGTDAADFDIDEITGAVTIKDSPDHETQSGYSFTVVVTDGAGHTDSQALTLAINDLDEIAPSITSSASAGIDENVSAGTLVYTVTSDDSADISSGVTYSFGTSGGDEGAFTIDPSTGAVTINASPDQETQASYEFTVVATDVAGHASEQTVTLTVNDLDEVAPSLTSGTTASAIFENSGTSQVIYTVVADDTADYSEGVTYSFAGTGIDDGKFKIDPATGAVTLPVNPNYEVQNSYSFDVVATDKAGHATGQTVTLAINNVDEVAPTFTSGATAGQIKENSGAAQVVYTATSTDLVDYVSGTTTYTLKAATGDGAAFSINGSSGAVTLTGNPDFETKSSYTFIVVATDAAGNVSERPVALNIKNVDEVPPTFTSGTTAAAINENSGTKQVIYTADSTDTVDFVNGNTKYSLKNTGDAALFSIQGNKGEVTLTGNPDFETKSSYTFTVIATDQADNFTEQTVTLAINNLDEVAPTITSGTTASAINENSGASQVVYTVTSTDSGDISSGVTYGLKAATGDVAAFSINSSTGAVTLTGNPNFEAKSSYSFTVMATDGAAHVTEKAVTLAINNLDEVAPVITSGTTGTTLVENSGTSQTVYTATSTDAGDISAGVTYSLKPATGDGSAFTINSSTGVVKLSGNPDYEFKSSYSFTVVATDGGNNTAEKAVTVVITNKDESAPVFSSGTTASVDENVAANSTVYTAISNDSTDYVTGSTTYSLKSVGDFANFSITGSTGVVKINSSPNFETKGSYAFTVVATDAAGNASERAVTLSVNNLDEVAPTITSLNAADAIDENTGAFQPVYTVTATDTDDISSGVTFSLKPSTGDGALFSINGSTGVVKLSPNPDYDAKNSYDFTVVATDGAGNKSELAVVLPINNLNEAPTAISLTPASFNENNAPGATVATLGATDQDAGDSFTYLLASGGADNGAFTIVGDALTLNGSADFESKSTYNIRVKVSDAGALTYETDKVVTVKNLDETAPVFTSGSAGNNLNENSGAGQTVYTAASTDAEVVTGSTTYSLKSVDDYLLLGIAPSTGVVTLTANPNYEAKTSYGFTVIATDGGGNTVEQAVSMSINNLDDTAPAINSGATASAINENSGAGQVVYTVTSDDSADTSTGSTVYSIKAATGDGSAFSIDSSTGAVALTADPNFEGKPSYSFTVVATDQAGNFSNQAVSLAINNVNEAPTITTGATVTATGFTFKAADVDAGTTLSYSAPFNSLGGTLNNGSTTTFTAAAQASVKSGDAVISDSALTVKLGLYLSLGTTGADSLSSSGSDPTVLFGFGGADTLTGGSTVDSLVGGAGADTLTGGAGVDSFIFGAGDSALTIGSTGNTGTLVGFDVVTSGDFSLAGADLFDTVGTPTVVANTSGVNGTDSSTLTIGGTAIKSHAITSGIVQFDDTNNFANALALTSTANVAAVVQYLQANDLGNAGATVAFTATISAVAHTYLFTQGDDAGTNNLDVLVDLVGVTATGLMTAGTTAGYVLIG